MDVVSRSHCCDDEHKSETMEHLFLTSPIAQKLWEKFDFCAGIKLHGIQLQYVITNWWKAKGPLKIKRIFKFDRQSYYRNFGKEGIQGDMIRM